MLIKKVIPRDLFNEGNLLTNYGYIYIELELLGMEDRIELEGNSFDVEYTEDGETYLSSVVVKDVNDLPITIYRPLNSRERFSLCFIDRAEEYQTVFQKNRKFTEEFLKCLKGER